MELEHFGNLEGRRKETEWNKMVIKNGIKNVSTTPRTVMYPLDTVIYSISGHGRPPMFKLFLMYRQYRHVWWLA